MESKPRSPAESTREALRKSDERFRAFVEQSAEGVWCFEIGEPIPVDWPIARQIEAWYERSHLSECNTAMARMYGYDDPAELVGARLGDLLPPDEPASIAYLTAFIEANYRMVDAESAEPARDGSIKHYLNNLVGTVENGGLVRVWGTQRDITELKRLQTQLQQSQKLEALGLMAGGLAHDFNNLLTAILGYSDLLLARTEENDPRRRDLGEIRKAGISAAALIRQLLAFGRRQVLEPRVLDLNEVVVGLEPMLHRLVGDRVELRIVSRSALSAVRADPLQVEQVLINLAVNARDAMPEGGRLTIETAEVELDEAYAIDYPGVRPGGYVLLAVSDTGVGMADEIREHIFEPFFTTKEIGRGTGLGLASVYGIVKQSGGHIAVYSEPGLGSSFKIYLPRLAHGAGETRPAAAPEGAVRPVHVLVVEDRENVRELVRRLLTSDGHRVLEATDLATARRAAKGHAGPLEVLLTDVVLREGSGREVAEVLRRERPELRVIFMSGYADEAVQRQGRLEADSLFLQKPFTAEALRAKLRLALEERRAA